MEPPSPLILAHQLEQVTNPVGLMGPQQPWAPSVPSCPHGQVAFSVGAIAAISLGKTVAVISIAQLCAHCVLPHLPIYIIDREG